MENPLLMLDVWLVLTALWLLVTFRKFALGGARAVLLKWTIFAVFVYSIMRLPEAACVLLADMQATTSLLILRGALVGTIILMTVVKVLRRRIRGRTGKLPSIL